LAPTGGPFARVDNMLSGRAGLVWQPTDTQSYYVAYGTSYNPSGELGVYGANATNLNAQTQLLDPEKNRNYELGAEWNLFEYTRLRAAFFRNEKTNARIDVDPGAINVTALAGKQRVDGLELELAGRINRNWDVFGAYAYMDGKVVTDPNGFQGRELIVPAHSGSLWSVYRLGGGWEVGGGAFAASEQFVNFANTVTIPAYWRWDAMVAYVQKKYDVRLNLLNITDETYYIGGYQNSGNRVLPGNPRTALLTLRYKFD
jgi:catecholate siderophore receptor